MKLLYFIVLLSLLAGCSKQPSNPVNQKLQGIWVEKTLRLDTLDFDTPQPIFGDSTVYFNSKTYWDYSISTTVPIINSAIYDYYVSGDSIYLHSCYSSCWKCYVPYWFKMNGNKTGFQIGKFYRRSSLPGILEFEKIK